ncbi:hypothetical protein EDD85DRAFT_795048 [Armillaria nabsnona]|nr:hypothetical protein EDD85DRAFT_795048 [Armillaria nabsnona]
MLVQNGFRPWSGGPAVVTGPRGCVSWDVLPIRWELRDVPKDALGESMLDEGDRGGPGCSYPRGLYGHSGFDIVSREGGGVEVGSGESCCLQDPDLFDDNKGDDGNGYANGDGLDGSEVGGHRWFSRRDRTLSHSCSRKRKRTRSARRVTRLSFSSAFSSGGVGGGVWSGGAVVDGYGRFWSYDVVRDIMQRWKVPSSASGVSLLRVKGVKSKQGEDE